MHTHVCSWISFMTCLAQKESISDQQPEGDVHGWLRLAGSLSMTPLWWGSNFVDLWVLNRRSIDWRRFDSIIDSILAKKKRSIDANDVFFCGICYRHGFDRQPRLRMLKPVFSTRSYWEGSLVAGVDLCLYYNYRIWCGWISFCPKGRITFQSFEWLEAISLCPSMSVTGDDVTKRFGAAAVFVFESEFDSIYWKVGGVERTTDDWSCR